MHDVLETKYVVIAEENDGYQCHLLYDTFEKANEKAKEWAVESEENGDCLTLDGPVYVAKIIVQWTPTTVVTAKSEYYSVANR